jgi:hypothetical protein
MAGGCPSIHGDKGLCTIPNILGQSSTVLMKFIIHKFIRIPSSIPSTCDCHQLPLTNWVCKITYLYKEIKW